MKEKIKLFGICNEGNYNILILEKHRKFLDWLGNSLECGLDMRRAYQATIMEGVNKKDELYTIKKKIGDLEDKHEKYYEEEIKVDVFYGKEKVFLMVRCPIEIRKKFIKTLEKTTKWVKK